MTVTELIAKLEKMPGVLPIKLRINVDEFAEEAYADAVLIEKHWPWVQAVYITDEL